MGLLFPPPAPRGPEVLHLSLKAFNLLTPPRSLCPDILGKDKASRGCLGTLQPPQPPHQHLALLNRTALPPSLPSKACGLRFRATVS